MNAQARKDQNGMIASFWIGVGIAVVLLGGLMAHGESIETLPEAPKAQKTAETAGQHKARMIVLGTVGAGRLGDLYTTGRCNHLAGCKEGELSAALASSPAGMFAFETVAVGLEAWGSNRLARRHPKLAFAGDLLSSAIIWSTVGHNAALQAGRPSVAQFHKLSK